VSIGVIARRAGQKAIVRLAHVNPRLALATAAFAGHLGRAVRSDVVTLAELGALLGHLPPSRLPALRRAIDGRSARTTLFRMLLARRELKLLKPCLRVHGFERLHTLAARQAPAILLTWHTGPYLAVGTALHIQGFEVLVMQRRATLSSDAVRLDRVSAEGAPWRGAAALKAAVDRLRGGGFVLLAGDGRQGVGGVEAPVLGHRLLFRQGLATLVRLSGAPVLPIVASWSGNSIDVTVHPPLELPTGVGADELEETVVRVAACWLDGYLRAAPEELWPERIREILAAPAVNTAAPALSAPRC
jgi:lauroyl/myristoyl acyltransferase